MDLRDSLRLSAKKFPKKTCIVFENKRFTYHEIKERVNRLAQALRNLGIRKGDRIGIMQVNCYQYIEVIYASAQIGAIFVPINFRLKAEEIEYIVNHAKMAALILGERYIGVLESIRNRIPSVKLFISLDVEKTNMIYYEEIIRSSTDQEVVEKINERDTALIFYTSGTTGRPKGTMLSYRGFHHNALNAIINLKLDHRDTVMGGGPLYHIGTFGYLIPSIYMGSTWVMMRQFDAVRVLELIEGEKVTVCWLAPSMINLILHLPQVRDYDLTSLRLIQYGGSPMLPQVARNAADVFKCNFSQIYGLTEAVPQTFLDPEDHIFEGSEERVKRLASVGRPAPNVDLRIENDKDGDVSVGEIGEIICQCDWMMEGYWRQSKESKKALKGGWMHTGDLGYRDEEGYIYLVDRKKDMIIRGGENIYPAEVERVLSEHPKIIESAVIGIPDETWGESVKAIVVLKGGEQATEEEIIEYCRRRLASYKKPTTVDFLEALPRNAAGKVLKMELKAKFWGGKEKKI